MMIDRFHPLVLTLVVYALTDVAFSCALGLTALNLASMWTNPAFPLINAVLTLLAVMSVYFVAYSNIKLALVLHGFLKTFIIMWSLHCVVMPEFYHIERPEAIATSLYFLLTLLFEMTAFFVINKMNIPMYPDDEGSCRSKDFIEDDEDEVMVTCC